MRAVLGARCCGSLLTAAELDVAVHTAHRELQASLRRARSRLLLRATTSTFDHFEFAVFSGSVFAPGARRGGLQRWQLRAPRPRRPPPTAPQHALSVAAAAIAVLPWCVLRVDRIMNNARRAPRAHASLQPCRRCEAATSAVVSLVRKDKRDASTRERIVVIERRAVAWELRGRTCGAPIGSRVQGKKGKSASFWRQAWKPVEPAPPRALCTDDHRKIAPPPPIHACYPMWPHTWWGRCRGAAVLQAAPCYLPASLAPHTVALRTPLPLRSLSRARAAQRHFSATAPAARPARVSEHVRAQKGLRPRRGRWQGARVERCGVG